MYNKMGQFGTDLEERVNFERLRSDRLRKTREAMKKHDIGAIVATRIDNTRYITGFRGIMIEGTVARYVILPQDEDPVLFEMGGDYGRAKETAPWLREKLQFSLPILSVPYTLTPIELEVRDKLTKDWAKQIKDTLDEYGVADKKIGFDFMMDMSAVRALEHYNIEIVDAQPVLMEARQIKTEDELQLLSIASQIAEAGLYTIEHAMKPGVRECEIWAEANKTVIALGAERLQGICTTGGRTNPYYRIEGSDKILRPGDMLITDVVLSYMGYHTCVVRTFLVGDKPTKEQKQLYRAAYDAMYRTIEAFKPGVMSDQVAAQLPETNWANFSLNICHGLGLHEHESPFIADAYSSICPTEIQKNMYMAVETYEGREGSDQGVRLEENFLVNDEGVEIFSRYPFDERFLD